MYKIVLKGTQNLLNINNFWSEIYIDNSFIVVKYTEFVENKITITL